MGAISLAWILLWRECCQSHRAQRSPVILAEFCLTHVAIADDVGASCRLLVHAHLAYPDDDAGLPTPHNVSRGQCPEPFESNPNPDNENMKTLQHVCRALVLSSVRRTEGLGKWLRGTHGPHIVDVVRDVSRVADGNVEAKP